MIRLTVLGARGSMPVSGKEYMETGGGTSCIACETETCLILFDGGSGICNLKPEVWRGKKVHLFLSHLHMDHIMGIPMCPMFYDESAEITVYAARESLDRFLARPFWPVGTESFKANVTYRKPEERLTVSEEGFTIVTAQGSHPGGCSVFRLETEGKKIIYATDINIERSHHLTDFCKGADLMFIDGQYTPEEYETRADFGHSDMSRAAAFMKTCEAGRGYLFHHATSHTDAFFRELEAEKGYVFAKEGDIIEI